MNQENTMLKEEINIDKKIPEKVSSSISKILISAKGIKKSFGGQVVFDNISLELRQGEVVLLRGENGSGKTTLLNILTGNLEPDKGEIHVNINGSEEGFIFPRIWWKELNPFDHFTPERLAWEGVGRLWQDIRLFPTMTTLENVAVAAQNQKGENPAWALLLPQAKREEVKNKEASSKWLNKFGLSERIDSSCDKISLGQMKRVAMARAIQAGAKVLFLDEPLSGLDTNGITEVMGYLESLAKENSITLVIVEHVFNIPTILRLAETVWTLSGGQLTVSKSYGLAEDKNKADHDLKGLLKSIAGENGKIYSEDLPNGAKLTTAVPLEYIDSKSALEVKDLSARRGIRTVMAGLSLNIKEGQLSILEAPNGWGKSTLLDVISGIHPRESGSIILNGEEISTKATHQRIKRGLSYLRANQQAFMSLSVEEHRKLANSSNAIFNGSLNRNSKGSFLSGGEKQKLLIEMLSEADVYLLDEPMIGLDSESIAKLSKNLLELVKSGKSLVITIPTMVS